MTNTYLVIHTSTHHQRTPDTRCYTYDTSAIPPLSHEPRKKIGLRLTFLSRALAKAHFLMMRFLVWSPRRCFPYISRVRQKGWRLGPGQPQERACFLKAYQVGTDEAERFPNFFNFSGRFSLKDTYERNGNAVPVHLLYPFISTFFRVGEDAMSRSCGVSLFTDLSDQSEH